MYAIMYIRFKFQAKTNMIGEISSFFSSWCEPYINKNVKLKFYFKQNLDELSKVYNNPFIITLLHEFGKNNNEKNKTSKITQTNFITVHQTCN